jgi:hypothetical protein
MNQVVAYATGEELEAMKRARSDLGRREAYLSTAEATAVCRFEVAEETLMAYPDWILPRIAKNPRAKRPSWLFDPRDVDALPFVLRLWERAIAEQNEEAFRLARLAEIEDRDRQALARIMGRAA